MQIRRVRRKHRVVGRRSVRDNTVGASSVAELHEQARRAIQSAEKLAKSDLREAAECLAQAKKLGASQQESADAIGKSKVWVSLLLRWRTANYAYSSPFHPPCKSKAGLSDKQTPTRHASTAEAVKAMGARAKAVEAIWRRKDIDALQGSHDELETFYRAWAAEASPQDRESATALVIQVNAEMGRKAA
jgi:hypothetical protein